MSLQGGYLEFEATLRGTGMTIEKIESLYHSGLLDMIESREALIEGALKLKAAKPEFFEQVQP